MADLLIQISAVLVAGAIACSLLRQLHAIITTDTPWNPALAGGPTTTAKETIPAA